MAEKGRQEDTPSGTIRREMRVVLSRNRSPLPSRIAKLVLFALVTRGLYGTRWFRARVFGLPVARLATHLPYRTRCAAGRDRGVAGETWGRRGRRRLRE